jgi:uncharacterized membrane protein
VLEEEAQRVTVPVAVVATVPEPDEVGAAIEAEVAASIDDAPPELELADMAAAAPPKPDMEQRLATRWFVWIGGLAIAVGGLLFVKYAYDVGLISPSLQIVLGLVLAAALVGAGHVMHARMPAGDYVPQALTSAGLAVGFGSIYAAYALYELISPALAFAGLGALGISGLLLALRHGPMVAALGLAGSYLTPTLIASPNPSAWSFFPYLLIIQLTCFAVLRRRSWWWLGYAAIAGSTLWATLWIGGPFVASHALPVGLFALAMGTTAILVIDARAILQSASGSLGDITLMSPELRLGSLGVAAAAFVLVALVLTAGHSFPALSMFATGMAGIAAISWFKQGRTYAAPAAAALTLLVLMSWRQASFIDWALGDDGIWVNILGSDARSFLRWMLGAGAAFMVLGLAGVTRKLLPLTWAALAAGAGGLYLVGAWARVDSLLSGPQWALLAGIVAAVLGVVAWSREAKVDNAEDNLSSGVLAVGVAVLLAFVADRLLNGVWLAIAWAGLAAAFAACTLKSRVALLGPISAALASAAALRLFLARELWLNDRSLPLGGYWPLYGYGVPAVLFLIGSRWLKRSGHLRWSMALEGLALGLAITLVSLELRVLIAGNVALDNPHLLEMAAHAMAWLGAAYGLAHRQQLFSSFISRWGARILIAAGVTATILFNLLLFNPAFTNEPVPGNFALNALTLAYAAPAVLLALLATKLPVLGWDKLRQGFGVVSLVLGLAYVTLQTKWAFQGRLMQANTLSDAEGYAYSAVWLVCALALFIAGLKFSRQYIRYAGLAVTILVVSKVFLLDMAGLQGLYRIGSFIGLGLCLVGIGWLYQKFLMAPAAPRGA